LEKITKNIKNRKIWQNLLRMVMGQKGPFANDYDDDDPAGDSSQTIK
jgi:hypothetical protein